jgi:UDP-N-acetylmuramoylalanine--D-glutamate ligase
MIAGITLMKKAYTKDDFAGMPVTVLGLGASGVAACRVLSRVGARVRASDNKQQEALGTAARELRERGIEIESGGNRPSFARGSELVVLSPGVPLDNPIIEWARSEGVPVISEVELAYCLSEARFAAITGTNGKTTTTSLLGAMLTSTDAKVHVCGNIGVPITSVAAGLGRDHILVVEVSSFQLDTCVSFRPEVGVLLNVTPDHLDRYPSYEAYTASKGRLFMNQEPGDHAVVNYDDDMCMAASRDTEATNHYFSLRKEVPEGAFIRGGRVVVRADRQERTVFAIDTLKIKGPHNLANSLAAALAALALGFEDEAIRKGITGFEGLEHRYEHVADIAGVAFINDSKATNIDSVRVALEAARPPVFLIAGGRDKEGDFGVLAPLVRSKVREILAIGEAREKLERTFSDITPVLLLNSLEEAVSAAREKAEPGATVLLSPGCASYDMFSNFEERGRAFKKAVLGGGEADRRGNRRE